MPVYFGKQKVSLHAGSPTAQLNGQTKIVTPSNVEQIIIPDVGYNCLTKVTVSKIPYKEEPNSSGGITITIG